MSLFEDHNKTEITKDLTAAVCSWLDERGGKPVETEVAVETGWVADVATVLNPTQTELQDLKLVRRKPGWAKRDQQEAWEIEARPFNRLMSVLVEVKTSRSDFLRDAKWGRARPTDLCWLAVPVDLISRLEWPYRWGILEYSTTSTRLFHRRRPVLSPTSTDQRLSVVYQIACRRDSHSRYEHLRRIQRKQRQDENEGKSLTRVHDALRFAKSVVEGRHDSYELAVMCHGFHNMRGSAVEDFKPLFGVARKNGDAT